MIYYVERAHTRVYSSKDAADEDARERVAAGRAGWTVEVASVDGVWEVSEVRSL